MNQNLTEFDELIVSRLISCTQSSRADILAFLDPFIVIDQREEWVSTITIKELQEPDLEVVNKAKEADWEVLEL